jgi:hypothetical protein
MLLLFWSAAALSTASPSITLALAPAAYATRMAQASPAIVLALAPAASQTHLAEAAPSITLALAARAIGGRNAAGSTVIELQHNAAGSTVTGDQKIALDESGVSTLTLRVSV